MRFVPAGKRDCSLSARLVFLCSFSCTFVGVVNGASVVVVAFLVVVVVLVAAVAFVVFVVFGGFDVVVVLPGETRAVVFVTA